MSAIQPITNFPIGNRHFVCTGFKGGVPQFDVVERPQTDVELFGDYSLDMRACKIDGKHIAKGLRAMPLWRLTAVEPAKLFTPDMKPCRPDDNGGMVGDAKRLAALEGLKAAYASGEYESYEHPYDAVALSGNSQLASLLEVEGGGVSRKLAELDWGGESVNSL